MKGWERFPLFPSLHRRTHHLWQKPPGIVNVYGLPFSSHPYLTNFDSLTGPGFCDNVNMFYSKPEQTVITDPQMLETISVRSRNRNEWIDITSDVQHIVSQSGMREGHLVLFVPHTTAAITINEGADPSVQADVLNFLSEKIPHQGPYRHSEGNSDAHIKSTLVGISQTVLFQAGKLVLGTWQSIFFCEFDGPRNRSVHIHLMAAASG